MFSFICITKSYWIIQWQLVILRYVCVNHNLILVFGVFLFCSTPEPCGCKLRINYIFWLRTLFRYIYINSIEKKLEYFVYYLCFMLMKMLYFCFNRGRSKQIFIFECWCLFKIVSEIPKYWVILQINNHHNIFILFLNIF